MASHDLVKPTSHELQKIKRAISRAADAQVQWHLRDDRDDDIYHNEDWTPDVGSSILDTLIRHLADEGVTPERRVELWRYVRRYR